ncbi:MAG: purple acid phosphatase family protein [Methanobacteriota archaeon]
MRPPSLVAALFVLVTVASTAAAQAPQAGPSGIHIAFGPDAATSMSVAWTGPASVGAVVEYGPTEAYGAVTPAEVLPLPGDGVLAYRARITGLEPLTTYHYRAVMQGGTSADLTFTTGPVGGVPFRVTAWADQGVPDPANPTGEGEGDAAARNVQAALAMLPAFHLHAGDLSYANGVSPTWTRYFAMLEPLASRVPYLPAVGNHEREAGQQFYQYDSRFALPSAPGARWYAFRYGDAVFVSLDTEHACADPVQDAVPGFVADRCEGGPNEAQRSFLRDTLEEARGDPGVEWIVAFHHYPLWSDGPHGSSAALQAIWGPLYDEFGVDLVIQGHDHMYERSRPLRSGAPAANGTVYVTVGTGGAGLYEFQSASPPAWEAARATEHGFLLLSFDGPRLVGEFFTLDGAVADRFEIRHEVPPPIAVPDDVADEPESSAPGPPPALFWASLLFAARYVVRRRSI